MASAHVGGVPAEPQRLSGVAMGPGIASGGSEYGTGISKSFDDPRFRVRLVSGVSFCGKTERLEPPQDPS